MDVRWKIEGQALRECKMILKQAIVIDAAMKYCDTISVWHVVPNAPRRAEDSPPSNVVSRIRQYLPRRQIGIIHALQQGPKRRLYDVHTPTIFVRTGNAPESE